MRAKFRAISCGELLGASQRSQVEKVPETVVAGNVPGPHEGGPPLSGATTKRVLARIEEVTQHYGD